jgi:hypothetical protein
MAESLRYQIILGEKASEQVNKFIFGIHGRFRYRIETENLITPLPP